ncbi:hypothetical protein RJ55_06129 [Drechmeria coniospora]|nr:hypothetical protein RJ55_06129 [Drechmeria coniospora]
MEHSRIMLPDTVSSLFPDRPIRPLPSRRLREQLSPEVADSIKYPASTLDKAPLFYYPPYTIKADHAGQASAEPQSAADQGRRPDLRAFASLRNGVGLREEEEGKWRGTLASRPPAGNPSRTARNVSRPEQPRRAEAKAPSSAASSVDGYDSFENTNNKKKRKIPSAGDSALNGAHGLNSDLGSLPISTGAHLPTNDGNAERLLNSIAGYAAFGPQISNSQGFSGPGRGRLGRPRNGRSPLRALADGNGAWPGRSPNPDASRWPPEEEGAGIISMAIANAEKFPRQGQENMSLLQQHSSNTQAAQASTQFTFTCASQVPGTAQWSGQNRHSMSGEAALAGGIAPDGVHDDANAKATPGKPVNSRRKSRRRLERELELAGRHRRQMATASYFRQPPRAEDVWICEFCEYERIFGEPPRALIRDYEIKDRRHRQDEADRRRLLEKAKAKSRKGRKNSKTLAKAGHATQDAADQGPSDTVGHEGVPSSENVHSHSTQSEGTGNDDGVVDDYLAPQLPERPPAAGDGDGGGEGEGEGASLRASR